MMSRSEPHKLTFALRSSANARIIIIRTIFNNIIVKDNINP